MTSEFYTVKEVATKLRKSERCIRDWINRGCPVEGSLVKLRAAKFGKSWRVKDEWLVLFEHRVWSRSGERSHPDLE